MKKIYILKKIMICFIMLFCITLVACNDSTEPEVVVPEHTHTYSTKWSSDETHHWHKANCQHSDEISEKGEHIWDEGTITLEATVNAEGEMTYTCTVCEATKTEPIDKLDPPSIMYNPQYCPICDGKNFEAEKVTYAELPSYTPTTFKASSVSKSSTSIANGVTLHKYTLNKNNGNKVMVYVTEVDLDHAHIATGTADNKSSLSSKSVPYSMAKAYEKSNTNAIVVAAINGDFFGGTTVNACVKDGVILKDSHNAPGAGSYDYTVLANDLPASMPMLFGVSGKAAQINPIIKNGTVQETIDSKLFMELSISQNGKASSISTDYVTNEFNGHKTKVNLIYRANKEFTALAGQTVLKMKAHTTINKNTHGEICEITYLSDRATFTTTDEFYYVILPSTYFGATPQLGDIITFQVTSEDGTWEFYDQIIGCRQALVIEGNIASTVSKENSNSAQSGNVPRSAIGVLPNGNVVLISVEALNYGSHGSSSSTYGMNLPQLADFMRYIGVYSGANFDGGGSTQLIARPSINEDFKVYVRSSDTGSTNVSSTRGVFNSVLVYVDKESE